jgi:hypothetical protein
MMADNILPNTTYVGGDLLEAGERDGLRVLCQRLP